MKTTQRKLGRKILPQDNRALWIFDFFDRPKMPPAPAELDRSAAVPRPWGMKLNDVEGDCAIVAEFNAVEVMTANAGDFYRAPDSLIEQTYSRVTGFIPGDESTDNGSDPLKVFKDWRDKGIGINGVHKLGAWGQINGKRPEQLRKTVELFGPAYLCFQLPAATQDMGDVWDIPSGQALEGYWLPASWGGHAITSAKYIKEGMIGVTWDEEVLITWRYLAAYCDQPTALVSKDILNGQGVSPTGLNLDALNAALKAVRRI